MKPPTHLRLHGPRLPSGGGLSDADWAVRHRAGVALLWAHLPALTLLGLRQGKDLPHLVGELLLLGALASLATLAETPRLRAKLSRPLRASLVAGGLLTCSALLVHLTGGLIEAHFHFFVVVGLLTLYREWTPLMVAVVYVSAHHLWMGVRVPELVYNHPAALASPARWAAVHSVGIALAAAVHLLSWRLEDEARAHAAEAEAALERSRRMQRQAALELHDELVQGLATALYALDRGERDTSRKAIAGSLEQAKQIVTGLLDGAEPRRREAALVPRMVTDG